MAPTPDQDDAVLRMFACIGALIGVLAALTKWVFLGLLALAALAFDIVVSGALILGLLYFLYLLFFK